jgi:hypothetical protein
MNSLYKWLSIFFLGIVMVVFAGTGCGPTKEELRADEEARLKAESRERAAEEARRQAKLAEEARLQKARAAETSGDEAARQGQLERALEYYQEALGNAARYSDQDQRVRQAVIKAVQAMPTPPAVPESALRSKVEGETMLKRGGAESYEAASKEMEQAVLAAPWWADGYSILGTIREKQGKLAEALQNLQLYILAAPPSSGTRSAQAKIYELEAMKEKQEEEQLTQATWRSVPDNVEYRIAIEGGKLRAEAKTQEKRKSYSIQAERKGRALEGLINIPSYVEDTCDIPGETNPVSGTISEDGRSIEFHFVQSKYTTSKKYDKHVELSAETPCAGVIRIGKENQTIKLVKEYALYIK